MRGRARCPTPVRARGGAAASGIGVASGARLSHWALFDGRVGRGREEWVAKQAAAQLRENRREKGKKA